jgi:hypothetical protein
MALQPRCSPAWRFLGHHAVPMFSRDTHLGFQRTFMAPLMPFLAEQYGEHTSQTLEPGTGLTPDQPHASTLTPLGRSLHAQPFTAGKF